MMHPRLAILAAVLASAMAFGPVPGGGDIQLDVEIEGAGAPQPGCVTAPSQDGIPPDAHCKYTLNILGTTDNVGPGVGVPYCPCLYKPVAHHNQEAKKIKRCKQAAKWLKNNKDTDSRLDSSIPKTPEPLQENEDAYPHLTGCRYRESKKKVYYNPNNNADGQEDPAPLGNYFIVCKSVGDKNGDGKIDPADQPEPGPGQNNPCLAFATNQFGVCFDDATNPAPVPQGGCEQFHDRKGDCPTDACTWQDTNNKNTP